MDSMNNSIEMVNYTTGTDINNAQQITLTNFYAWEIRAGFPLTAGVFYVSPCNPAQDSSSQWVIGMGDPTSWSAGAYTLLSDVGTKWPTGHAELWIWSDVAQAITVWGVKKDQ